MERVWVPTPVPISLTLSISFIRLFLICILYNQLVIQ